MAELPRATLEKPRKFLRLLVGSTWPLRSHPAFNSPQGTGNFHDTWICGWLLPQPSPAGTIRGATPSVSRGCGQSVTACHFSVTAGGHWKMAWHNASLTNAECCPLGTGPSGVQEKKTQLLAAWWWKFQARFQKPSKLMSSWQSAKNLSGIKFPLFISPLQVNSLWK